MIKKIRSLVNTEEKKRLLGNFFSLFIFRISNYILPFITFPYLVRVLGVEKFGLLALATATVSYFNVLVDYGFSLTATKDISIYRDNKEELNKIFSSVMVIKILLMMISFLLLIIIVFNIEKFKIYNIVYFLSFGLVVSSVLFPSWFFQGIEKMKYITILNLIAKIIFTIAIFIFIHKSSDYWKVPLINSMGMIFIGLISIWIIVFRYNIKFVLDVEKIRHYLKYNFSFFISRIAVNIYTVSNTFVLGLVFNNLVVGYYSIAEKLFKILQSFYGIITQVVYPYMAKTKNKRLFKKILLLSFISNLFLIIILIISADFIFRKIFHVSSDEVKNVFYILMFANVFVIPTFLLGYPFLGVLGYEKQANLSVIYGAAIHLFGLGVMLLLGVFNIYTVAVMVVITEFFVLFYRIYYIRRFKLWEKR